MLLITANGLADLLSGPLPATSLDQSQRLIFDLVAFERQQFRRVNNAAAWRQVGPLTMA